MADNTRRFKFQMQQFNRSKSEEGRDRIGLYAGWRTEGKHLGGAEPNVW